MKLNSDMLIQSSEIRFVVFVVLILTELEADDALMAENTVSFQTRSIDHVWQALQADKAWDS